MSPAEPLLVRWQASVADTYGTPPMVLVSGSGSTVWDDQGNEYLDLLAGIAVNSLGHAHPAIVAAVGRQLSTLGHVSNLAATAPGIELAERLLDLAGRPGRVFFANSGAEANEAAFKLSRLTGRTAIVAAQGGFHGRTMGALALTGQPAKREPFEPLPPAVRHVPYGAVDALVDAIDDSVAAVVLEPIQGEAGVVPAPPGYLAEAQRAAHDAGALFIVDEVQTGIGRTGRWFAHQHEGLEPDAMALAKGLGGGLPIGALVAFGDAGELWRPGSHGSTFGGNPVSCAAALAVLDTIAAEGLVERAAELGEDLRGRLAALPGVAQVRGAGLLLGIVLRPGIAAKNVELRARVHGVICNAIGDDVIRLAPPLVITDAEVDRAVHALGDAIADVAAAAGAPASPAERP